MTFFALASIYLALTREFLIQFFHFFATKMVDGYSLAPVHMCKSLDWSTRFTFGACVCPNFNLNCFYVILHFLAVMKKDLLKIKKHSSDLFLKRNQTNPKDVKLHNDVEVSLSYNIFNLLMFNHNLYTVKILQV